MNELDSRIERVLKGKSRVFTNWNKFGLITEDEFIDALKWLFEAPEEREVALEISRDMENKVLSERADGGEKFAMPYDETKSKGAILRLRRVDDPNTGLTSFHDTSTNRLWSGNGTRKISISAYDRI
jgi:hypothetical protein